MKAGTIKRKKAHENLNRCQTIADGPTGLIPVWALQSTSLPIWRVYQIECHSKTSQPSEKVGYKVLQHRTHIDASLQTKLYILTNVSFVWLLPKDK